MKFSELEIGTKFKDIYAGLRYEKIAATAQRGRIVPCKYCGCPASEFHNARSNDGGLVHFCGTETVVVLPERVEVA